MKRCLCALLAACLMLPLAGCWNYRGLNEMTIVAGMAIDEADDGQYLMTFEVMDLSQPTKTEGPNSNLVFAKGGSILEAIRNAKRQLASKLYFGNMQIMVISHQVAEREGLDAVLDFALRDSEMRETMELVVSREETARAILSNDEKISGAVSYDISRIIREDAKVTGSVFSAQFYRIYDDSRTPGINVVLPVFYLAPEPDSDKKHVEAYGCAVFKGSLLAGFFSAEETKYLLMVNGLLTGGVLTFYVPEITKNNITLEIKKVDSSMSFENNDGKIAMKLSVKINAYFAEFPHNKNEGNHPVLDQVERSAENLVREELQSVIKKLQTQYQSDALGMGRLIYRTNLPLWRQISGRWNEMYQTLPVDVTVKIHLANTAMVRES